MIQAEDRTLRNLEKNPIFGEIIIPNKSQKKFWYVK